MGHPGPLPATLPTGRQGGVTQCPPRCPRSPSRGRPLRSVMPRCSLCPAAAALFLLLCSPSPGAASSLLLQPRYRGQAAATGGRHGGDSGDTPAARSASPCSLHIPLGDQGWAESWEKALQDDRKPLKYVWGCWQGLSCPLLGSRALPLAERDGAAAATHSGTHVTTPVCALPAGGREFGGSREGGRLFPAGQGSDSTTGPGYSPRGFTPRGREAAGPHACGGSGCQGD